MKRLAILIESSDTLHGSLPGMAADVENWRSYLSSVRGGAWDPDEEIIELHTPSEEEFIGSLELTRTVDYTFLSFSGHGEQKRSTPTVRGYSTAIINDDYEENILEMLPYSPKSLLVIDSCRRYVELQKSLGRIIKSSIVESVDERRREISRMLFDSAVETAEAGSIVMYSCKAGQSAADEDYGGVFTSALIDCGRKWRGKRVMTSKTAYECASMAHDIKRRGQEPEYKPGRRIDHFPFAIDHKDL